MRLYKRGTKWMADLRAQGLGRVSTGETSKAKAETVAAAMLTSKLVANSATATPEATTLGVTFETYKGTLDLTKRGQRDEVTRVKHFVDWAGHGIASAQVKPFSVTRWAKGLADTKSAATVARYRASLSGMFRWAIQVGLVNENPVRGSWCPSQSDTEKREPFSKDELKRIWSATEGTPLEAAYMLAIYAGMRRGEIVAARFEDVDLINSTIVVRGTKTKGSAAIIPLHPVLARWLKAQDQGGQTWIAHTRIGGQLHPCSLTAQQQRMGLPGFHRGRHTLATSLLEAGADLYHVSELMRHTSVKTTQKFYGHARPAKRHDVMSMLPDLTA